MAKSFPMKYPIYKTGLGQDSHRFEEDRFAKPCIIGGVVFNDVPGLAADSDGDLVYHALCNAITSITGKPILATIARDLCQKEGIKDSNLYLKMALETLQGHKIVHVAISLEGKRPKFEKRLSEMKLNIAKLMNLEISQIGITATSGDGLTSFGLGEGVQCFCIVTIAQDPIE